MSVSKRIVEVLRNMLLEGETEVRPERIPAALADQFLGRPLPPIRSDVPENTQKPACSLNVQAFHITDLEIRWDRVPGAARYQARDISGLNGTPRQIWEAGTIIDDTDGTKLTVVDKGAGVAPDPAAITDIMVEPFNKFGVPGECFEAVTVSRLTLPGGCPNLMDDPKVTELHCSPAPAPGPVVLYTFLPTLAANHPGEIVPGTTRVALCHKGSTSGGGLLTGFGTFGVQVVPSFTHNMYGTLGESQSQEWDRDTTVFTPIGQQRAFYGCYVGPESGQIRQRIIPSIITGSLGRWDPDPGRTKLHDPFGLGGGHAFRPGVVVAKESIGSDVGECYVYWMAATGGTSIEALNIQVRGLSSEKIRLTRAAGDPRLGATTIVSGVQTGDYEWPLHTVNNGAGYWDKMEILDASDVVQATFLGSEMPSGKIWPGSVFDFGGPYTLGPLCLAINAAADLCLEEDGYIFEEDWGAVSSIDAGKYNATGFTLDVANGRLFGSATSTIVRRDVGTFPDIVVMAVTGLLNDASAGHGPAAVMGSLQDIRSTLRATFDTVPPTVITGGGVSTGDLLTFAPETVLAGFLWPATATQLVVEQLQDGTSSGEACSRDVQLNVGSGCCTFTLPGLPNPTGPCLNIPSLVINSVDDCGGGLGLSLTVRGSINASDLCARLSQANGYHWRFIFEEERDPASFPGVFDPIKTLTDPIQFPAIPTTGNPVPYTVNTTIKAEDPFNDAPFVGSVRGSNGANRQLKLWRVVVSVDNVFLPSQPAVVTTSGVATPPAQYGWCP